MGEDLQQFANERFCYLRTTGRTTGRSHEIEIWFALEGATIYMLAGSRYESDWVKNIQKNAAVTVRIRERIFAGHGRIVDESSHEATHARMLVGPKYNEWQIGQPHIGWTWEALPVAVDLVIDGGQ